MEKTETGYNINTNDNGVLHFVIGCEYKAEVFGGRIVKGILRDPERRCGDWWMIDKKGKVHYIYPHTLSYL